VKFIVCIIIAVLILCSGCEENSSYNSNLPQQGIVSFRFKSNANKFMRNNNIEVDKMEVTKHGVIYIHYKRR
jgi:hypothetical protein